MSFWDIIWFIIVTFAFVAYLMVLFHIITDIFRDKSLAGWAKALWVICLVFFPLLTALVYLIARGPGMAERSQKEARQVQQSTDAYIRQVATASPADEIAKAKALLDAGTITPEEFAHLKSVALGHQAGAGAHAAPAAPAAPSAPTPPPAAPTA